MRLFSVALGLLRIAAVQTDFPDGLILRDPGSKGPQFRHTIHLSDHAIRSRTDSGQTLRRGLHRATQTCGHTQETTCQPA